MKKLMLSRLEPSPIGLEISKSVCYRIFGSWLSEKVRYQGSIGEQAFVFLVGTADRSGAFSDRTPTKTTKSLEVSELTTTRQLASCERREFCRLEPTLGPDISLFSDARRSRPGESPRQR